MDINKQPQAMVNEPLLKPSEISEILALSKSFVYRLLQTGAIPVVRMGRSCRVRKTDLAEYIENNTFRQADL